MVVQCKGGGGFPCAASFEEDSGNASPGRITAEGLLLLQPVGMVEAACTCMLPGAMSCAVAVDPATGDVQIDTDPDVHGDVTLQCQFGLAGQPKGAVQNVATLSIAEVNDPPEGTLVDAAGAKEFVALPTNSVAYVHSVKWLKDIRAGPATAADEQGQSVTATCTGTPGVFTDITLAIDMAGDGVLTYTVAADAPADAAGVVQNAITCTLTDEDGAQTVLPQYAADLQRLHLRPYNKQYKSNDVKHGVVFTSYIDNPLLRKDVVTDNIPFEVIGPQYSKRFGAGEPVLSVRTNKDKTGNSEYGLLHILDAASGKVMSVTIVPEGTTQHRIDVTINPQMEHEEYLLTAPANEELIVHLHAAMLTPSNPADVCDNCDSNYTITGASPAPANLETLTSGTTATAMSAIASSTVIGAPTSSATKASILAMASRAMLCPGDGPDKLDRTLNPLGITLGGDEYKEYNGAVLGSMLINFGLLAICSAAAVILHRSIRTRKGRRIEDVRHRDVSAKVDTRYVLMKSRFGWLPIPLCFLFGGACVGSFTALMYAPMGYKALAVLLIASFVVAFPYYVWRVVRSSTKFADYHDREKKEELSYKQLVFWGTAEWEARMEVPGSKTWAGLHHLVYDAYSRRWRYFLLIELGVILLLSLFTAWQPNNSQACWLRALGMTITLALFSLILLIARPYVAPYENVAEFLIALTETLMMVTTLLAMGDDNPSKHWGADASTTLGLIAMWMIVIKLVIDTTVFVIDEYDEWIDNGGAGGASAFLRYWFCFSGVMKEREAYCELGQNGKGSFNEHDNEELLLEAPGDEMASRTTEYDSDAEGLAFSPTQVYSQDDAPLVANSSTLRILNSGSGLSPAGKRRLTTTRPPSRLRYTPSSSLYSFYGTEHSLCTLFTL